MKKSALLLALLPVMAVNASERCDSLPPRAVILSGDAAHPDVAGNLAEMYSRANLAFEDPDAPRFLFLDKKGTVALGIGGSLRAIGSYDMDGAIASDEFVTNEIPVPFNPAQRQRFGATAAYSSLFLKLVTKRTRVGRVIVYIQSNFAGGDGGYGMQLKQAYVSVGHVTMGKARSTFADGPAMAPTIDEEGPSGQVAAKNMLVKYVSPSYKGFVYAASVEVPSATYTNGAHTEAIAQRFPDIPAYMQYEWDKGNSHVRLSGILRQLSYRDLLDGGSNRFKTGWGVQLSAVFGIYGGLGFFGHYTYGKGICTYINDLSGEGYDLVPAGDGRLKAPGATGWTAGLQYTFDNNLIVSASYSRAQLYDTEGMAADTYRYGQYIAANAFYNVWGDLRVGLEYLHGTHKEINGLSGHANRLNALLQYSF